MSTQPQDPKNLTPQESVNRFWTRFNTKYPGKVFTVLPDDPYARAKAAQIPRGVIQGQDADKSYEEARQKCEQAVARIVRECLRVNQKYTDPYFDIEVDLKSGRRDCLDGLGLLSTGMTPKGVKRVTDIFQNPQFFLDGPTAGDVRQGSTGDCWALAALSTMGNKEGLIEKICVARDEKVGVYGFVFHRDGEWQHCIVDDKLYLQVPDYDDSIEERPMWDGINRTDTEEEYRRVWQTGSRALYFAQCQDENETWLPLLEKAFAKAHGDYTAIEGGFVGEGIEDFTGGVTSEIMTSAILDKDKFWNEELMNVNKDLLYGCHTGLFANWLAPKDDEAPSRTRKGIIENHAYSILQAREIDGHRLLQLRNPWGKKEWKGAWSDGSEEWTPEWMQKLGHKFGNDGVFWISYPDLLKKFEHFDRTRLFGPGWTITQHWTTLNIPWSASYHTTKFLIDLKTPSPVVIILSQLDSRYFSRLKGEYWFDLKFRVQKADDNEDGDYIVRSNVNYLMTRSVNAEIELEPGRYFVLMKITAHRVKDGESTEEVIRSFAGSAREKLVQLGLAYDLAHAKAVDLGGGEGGCSGDADGQQTGPESEEREEGQGKVQGESNSNDNNNDNSNDPWNAVCVVGLRVYSKDPQLTIQVARPGDKIVVGDEGGETKTETAETEPEPPALDVDCPAAASTSSVRGFWRRTIGQR